MKSLILFAAIVAVTVAQFEELPALRANARFLSSPTTPRPRIVTVPTRTTLRPKPQSPAPTTARPSLAPLLLRPQQPAQPIPVRASPPPTTARPPLPIYASQPLPTGPIFIATTPAPLLPTTLAPPVPTQFIRISTPPREFFPVPSEEPTVLITRPPPPPSRPLSTAAPVLTYHSSADDRNAQLLSYQNEINPDGSYQYEYAVDNGIAASAQGRLVDVYGNNDFLSEAVQGSFQWSYPNGETVLITYVADENGYQPQGDALPTPPPIPPLIARALEWTARKLAERTVEVIQPLSLKK